MKGLALHLTSLALVNALLSAAAIATESPHADDPAILKQLAGLGAKSSLLLPPVKVHAGDLAMHAMEKKGPGQRDYCNRMPYVPTRQTALYAGGNHQAPHRMNDVWEYHLGSNSWHLLYGPDGGNAGKHKGAYFLTSRTLVRKPDTVLTDKQREQIAAYKKWWSTHVVFKDGHLATRQGGPIMPAHTWDAFCYDETAGHLLWGMGVSPAGQLSTHAMFTGKPIEHWQKQADASYTPMWMFDPAAKRWSHYRTDQKRASLRGMGATMVYLPDLKKTLWYVAARNVSPQAFEMWLFDAKADTWTELKPNNGKSIDRLVTKEGVAPLAEQQARYSPKHGKVVAVLKHDTFVYDVKKNVWSRAVTDERIYGHDARSVFVYDSHADVFLLAFPPNGRGKELRLASYSLKTNRWELVTPAGPAIPPTKYGMYMGYYDPRLNATVIQGRYSDRMWVYRHGR